MALVLCPPAAAAPDPDPPPPGANDWSCRPSAAHPNPVVLAHGLGANMRANWFYMAPALAKRGYCVFALTYGSDKRVAFPGYVFGGVIRMERSAEQLAAFVDRVLTATGAQEVDIVGHSEGTVMPRWYLEFLGGAAKVERFIGLTPLWRGTNVLNAGTLARLGRPSGMTDRVEALVEQFCASCPQFLPDSEYLTKLNADGGAVPGVEHTNIVSRYDGLVVPYTSGILHEPGVTNIVLQDGCELDLAEHGAVAFDPIALQHVFNALDPANAVPPRCRLVLPLVGGLGGS